MAWVPGPKNYTFIQFRMRNSLRQSMKALQCHKAFPSLSESSLIIPAPIYRHWKSRDLKKYRVVE
eukprot:867226-Amphidinium_carterae.1